MQKISDKNESALKAAKNDKIECQICLEEFMPSDNFLFAEYSNEPANVRNQLCKTENKNEGKRRYALQCGHDLFHYHCIKKWCQTKNDPNRNCPICKSHVLKID